jgi:hypothetical protein
MTSQASDSVTRQVDLNAYDTLYRSVLPEYANLSTSELSARFGVADCILDPDGVPQFGLVAEQVEKVNPDLVVRGEDGKVMTVRYEAVNTMLLNEFLKEHQKVEEQGATIAQMKKQIEALTATVQKVSDQVALSKPAPQLVANP